ncbi:MAG: DNA-binding transcriptional LysR family regulator [Flavobacteriales bacterium]|jgi:DNA-binding transcriptional LysR family regulator
MKFSLRQIEVFIAVARHENVSKAAEHLYMSQSAVSGSLKELEKHFNLQLFDRIGKRLQLNEHGKNLRAHSESLMAMANDIETELDQHSSLGKLTLGATLTIGDYLCAELIEAYLALAPQAKLKLNIANTHAIAQELLDFEIDVGLIEGEYQHPDLDIQPWRQDELVVFCATNHPLAQKHSVELKDLLLQEWILREQGSGTRQCFDNAMRGHLHALKIHLEFEHTEVIKRAVSRNMGISCLSKITLEHELQSGSLVALNCKELNLTRTLYLAIHRHKYHSPSIDAWLNICKI